MFRAASIFGGLLALLLVLISSRRAVACGEAFSRCASLETILPTTTTSDFFAVHSLRPESPPVRLALYADYQRRPLVVQVSSPDPFGRELPLLEDWLVLTPSLDFGISEQLRAGANLPLGLQLSALDIDAISNQTARAAPFAAFGDPDLFATFSFDLLGLRAGIVQRLSLPLGQSASFIAHSGPRYAPSIALARDLGSTTLAIELGARLRKREPFGDTSFGSEALFLLGVSQNLSQGFHLGAELFAMPALHTDRTAIETSHVALRRVPAGWLLGARHSSRARTYALSAGTSLPLTSRQTENNSEHLLGPPGPAFRVLFRVEQHF